MMRRPAGLALLSLSFTPCAVLGQLATGTEPMSQINGVAVSLAVVVGLIIVGAWLVRRSPLGGVARRSGAMSVVATLPLGPKERLVLVEALDRKFLLGVSPAGITALHHLDTEITRSRAVAASSEQVSDSFRETIELAQNRQLAGDSA